MESLQDKHDEKVKAHLKEKKITAELVNNIERNQTTNPRGVETAITTTDKGICIILSYIGETGIEHEIS